MSAVPVELSAIDLNELTMDDVRAMKNEAVARLKKAGQFSLNDAMHQNGVNHNNHTTTIAPEELT